MGSLLEFEIRPAAREWSRQFHNVVRSFAKTITEAVTNSDTSYKRKFNIPDSSGLVDLILNQQKGTKFNSSELKKQLVGKYPKREIQIRLYTAKGHEKESRTCQIVDFAEGLSPEKLQLAFKEYAADKSSVSEGRPGRSLFGRGISDVLLGHKRGEFSSYKDGILSKATFEFNMTKGEPPKCRIEKSENPKKELSHLHLDPNNNGSSVFVYLNEDCAIPDEGTIVPSLSQFYMVRLINSDPNVSVRLIRHRAQKQKYEDILDYDFPIGDVIENITSFDLSVPHDAVGENIPPLKVDGIICRADVGSLKGKEAKDNRENGLLIIDEKDSVLDLTFLPDFEGAPYLNRIYGIIRINGIRAVFDHLLNNGKESPLTITRDGFDSRHDFTQFLFKELKKKLEPIYKKEEEHFKKSEPAELSQETKKRIQEALKHLNKYLTELMGEGEGGELDKNTIKDLPIQFIPTSTRLTVGRPRIIHLVLRAKDAKEGGIVVIDSNNSKVLVTPTSYEIEKSKNVKGFILQAITLRSEDIHEKAIVSAIAEGVEQQLEASIEVEDVVAAPILEPPKEMEFRPSESKGLPNRRNNLVLFINSSIIPVGRIIEFSIEKAQGSLNLIDDKSQRVDSLEIRFTKSHLLKDTSVGRILVPWQGSGLGQRAKVKAATKISGGKVVLAFANIIVEQTEYEGGHIRDVQYRELESSKCSDLVDGIIYINSLHSLNKEVFGRTQKEYSESVKQDRTAQYRLATILVEQSVFRLAEEYYLKSKLSISTNAPVTSLREFVDENTNALAPKLLRVLLVKSA